MIVYLQVEVEKGEDVVTLGANRLVEDLAAIHPEAIQVNRRVLQGEGAAPLLRLVETDLTICAQFVNISTRDSRSVECDGVRHHQAGSSSSVRWLSTSLQDRTLWIPGQCPGPKS